MLRHIPTHLIAGPLGAGKTSTLRALLTQRPAGERWAVLINEFGQIGLDLALLQDAASNGAHLAEIAGGCLCCVNGAPFQIGLARLLRQAQPDRLFIEPSGLGHPQTLLAQLSRSPWNDVLAVQPCVMVLDASALAQGAALPPSQHDALALAELLVMNKSEALDASQRASLTERFADHRLYWTQQGELPIDQLPGIARRAGGTSDPAEPVAEPPRLWLDPTQPQCDVQSQAEGWSMGWRWHPSQRLVRERLLDWLGTLAWQRAKLVFQDDGSRWLSGNATAPDVVVLRPSEWRRDSRIELIFDRPQDASALSAGMLACRQA